jgi:serine/threonine-protein kinase RsbW
MCAASAWASSYEADDGVLGALLARTEMSRAPNLRLNLRGKPENVLLVRQALSGVAETLCLDPLELNDISTAVSEACNNVALHAYEGAEGPLELEIYVEPEALGVVVRDHGVGIQPRIESTPAGGPGGIGLPIMLALAQSVEFTDLDGHGTEVRLEFAIAGPAAELSCPIHDEQRVEVADLGQDHDVTAITLAPAALARSVLPRVLSALAARAFFSTDRISDTQLLADALVAHANGALSGSHLSVGISVAPRELDVRIGPLQSGRASALVLDSKIGGLGSVLTRLADSHEISAAGSAEVLALRLADNGARPSAAPPA